MQKDILAKLLATENITVVHENAPTASFNVKDRVLTLPLWEDLTGDNYDHFIGHEVGHALYTPEDGWHDAVCERGRAYKSFLNVVEDARIERLIQVKYPGLRRNFINSYKKLLADGFFGADLDEINTFDLIDRINSYFKLGASAGVRIEKDEVRWIKEIESAVTWEQVVEITDRLYAEEKAKKEEEQEQQESQMQDENGTDETDGEGTESGYNFDEDDQEDEQEGNESEGTGDSEDSDGEEDESDPSDEEGEGEEEDNESEYGELTDPTDPISKTEEALHKNIRKEFGNDTNTKVFNISLNTNKLNEIVVPYTEAVKFTDGESFALMRRYGENLWKKFQSNNKKTVNYMVKEFEMKKKAGEYARTSLAKTGVIDSVKMNNYKFSDDIFRKVAVTPEGKNHGLVMYLDWSGSMHEHMKHTIDQLLNLVMFCRQVNIPYRVYMFTDRYRDGHLSANNVPVNTMVYKDGFRLVELFSNKMNRTQFTRMASDLLAVGQNYSTQVTYYLPHQYYLGGTPLDDAIMAAMQIHFEFKKQNRLDLVNTVFLTDGDSHPIEMLVPSSFSEGVSRTCAWNLSPRYNIIKFIDPITKKQYRMQDKRNSYTKILLEMFRDRTGSNAIGYRIVGMSRRALISELRAAGLDYNQIENKHKELRKEKFITIPNAGYSKFFAIAGGKNLEVANTSMEVADDASKGQIRSAFKKANGNRKSTRVLLSQFIEMIA